jgi:hypothetical protein
LIVSKGFKYTKRGREVERRSGGVRSKIKALPGDIGARDFI